ncbi:MAG: cell wall metabolism sensor histidine kinase WalK [Bacillota bacterium]|nr:cell wall metabolism sensor histidine kinase WalK [Bacillota bacterium]
MKNKIAFKLTMYFSVILLLFSIIIGSVFMALFKKHTLELNKSDLQKRAVNMADTLSDFMSSTVPDNGMGSRQGFGAYLRFLDQIAMSDVWIVDENLQIITAGHMAGAAQYNYSNLPPDAEKVVKEVFQGKTTFSQSFSNILASPALTVGTPIKSGDKVIGALLLHSPINGMNEAVTQGLGILAVSILSALALSMLLSVVLAVGFTRPLKKMKNTAMELSSGNYSVKTGIYQDDEIGELASAFDDLSNRLDAAQKESNKLNKLRRDFVANISHELRTPVTVIRGSLEALCDRVVTDPDQIKTYHEQMLSESKFLERLVNDLLDLSRLQNTDFKMEMQEISLCDVLSDAIRSARQMALSKNIEIKMEQDVNQCSILGDYGRLRQMFLIILHNAVKFSPNGSIVTVSNKGSIVSIKDSGIGISKEDLPYIFDRFYKVNSEKNKNGTGLGLAIANEIALRHNIKISVRSEKSKGTEFIFDATFGATQVTFHI